MEKPLQMSDFIQNGGVIIVGKMCIIRHFTKKCLTATKHSWKKFELIDKRSTVDTISFSDSFLFFRLIVWIDLRCCVLLPFFFGRREKKVLFYHQSFFVISPIKSIPFFNFSRDHLRSILGIICDLGTICGTVQHPSASLRRVFALVPTFSTNSRGNACYAGYPSAKPPPGYVRLGVGLLGQIVKTWTICVYGV